jgi:hypothetical protein
MKGDFTRDTFDPSKHFTRVLMQQGRVQLDSDWNEQASILLHSLRALAADLIGPFGGPGDNFGFQIFTAVKKTGAEPLKGELPADDARLRDAHIVSFDTGELLIGKGRYYVGGLLCENDGHVLYTRQADAPGRTTLNTGFHLAYLDVWEHLVTHLEDDSIREVALGGPDTAARARVVWQVKTWSKNDDAELKIDGATTRDQINNDWGKWVERFEADRQGG